MLPDRMAVGVHMNEQLEAGRDKEGMSVVLRVLYATDGRVQLRSLTLIGGRINPLCHLVERHTRAMSDNEPVAFEEEDERHPVVLGGTIDRTASGMRGLPSGSGTAAMSR